MSIFGKLAGALIGTLFGPVGMLLGVLLGHLADMASERNTRAGAFGSETSELVVRLFSLWGRIAAFGGGLNRIQIQFLQGVVVQQLQLQAPLARLAQDAFDEAVGHTQGKAWTEVLADTTEAAREIYEDFFLDRRTLIWVYATGRRMAALGTVRPGLAELLDAIARVFLIFEEVGSAGIEGAPRNERSYEQTWQNFRPGATADPEAYRHLGLTPEASADEIKQAYRALVRRLHPDSHSHLPEGDPQKKRAAEQFLKVQQAYERIRQDRKF